MPYLAISIVSPILNIKINFKLLQMNTFYSVISS